MSEQNVNVHFGLGRLFRRMVIVWLVWLAVVLLMNYFIPILTALVIIGVAYLVLRRRNPHLP